MAVPRSVRRVSRVTHPTRTIAHRATPRSIRRASYVSWEVRHPAHRAETAVRQAVYTSKRRPGRASRGRRRSNHRGAALLGILVGAATDVAAVLLAGLLGLALAVALWLALFLLLQARRRRAAAKRVIRPTGPIPGHPPAAAPVVAQAPQPARPRPTSTPASDRASGSPTLLIAPRSRASWTRSGT
jgi:hypothetical protein